MATDVAPRLMTAATDKSIYLYLYTWLTSVLYSLSQSAAGLSRDSRPFPYGKSSELIVTNLWVGPRPLTHNTPGQRGHNPSTYIPYLLTAR